jgi:hypothetical protein
MRSTQTDGDVRHGGAGLDGVHRATAVPNASSASRRYGTGNPIERIANTGQIGRGRRRRPVMSAQRFSRQSEARGKAAAWRIIVIDTQG